MGIENFSRRFQMISRGRRDTPHTRAPGNTSPANPDGKIKFLSCREGRVRQHTKQGGFFWDNLNTCTLSKNLFFSVGRKGFKSCTKNIRSHIQGLLRRILFRSQNRYYIYSCIFRELSTAVTWIYYCSVDGVLCVLSRSREGMATDAEMPGNHGRTTR